MSRNPSVQEPGSSPEIKFWKRYSPHHELPLSSAMSVLLHTLLVGLLFLAGVLVVRSRDTKPLEIGTLVIGDGSENGGEGERAGAALEHREAGPRMNSATEPNLPIRPEKALEAPQPKPIPLPPVDDPNRRIIGEAERAVGQLSARTRDLRDRLLQQQRAQRPGGPSGSGPQGSPSGRMNNLARRMDRWVLTFETRDGFDYLRQLEALGAILAVPLEGDRFLVIRDLKQRPARGTIETVADMHRIFWIDDKPESVRSLARALPLERVPARIVAFFPNQLEDELLRKELAFRNRREEDIRKTYFRLRRNGDRFEPVVVDQEDDRH